MAWLVYQFQEHRKESSDRYERNYAQSRCTEGVLVSWKGIFFNAGGHHTMLHRRSTPWPRDGGTMLTDWKQFRIPFNSSILGIGLSLTDWLGTGTTVYQRGREQEARNIAQHLSSWCGIITSRFRRFLVVWISILVTKLMLYGNIILMLYTYRYTGGRATRFKGYVRAGISHSFGIYACCFGWGWVSVWYSQYPWASNGL